MDIRKAATPGAILLLVLMALLAGVPALHESITIDEVAHIGAGVSYLQKLDLRMNPEHPPLAKVIAAVPLAIQHVYADYNSISWNFSGGLIEAYLGEWVFGHWLFARWNDPISTVTWARLPMLLLMLGLGWAIYRCGSRFGGAAGGLLSLCAYTTMPVFLAFGPLVLTDIVVTLFSLLTLWSFAEMWSSGSPANIRRFGLLLAASLLSKFSAGLLFIGFIAFALSVRRFPTAEQPGDAAEFRLWWRRGWRNTAKGTLLAAAVVYAAYFLLSWNQPTDTLKFLGAGTLSLVLRRFLMPALLYLWGVALFALGSSRPTFLLGHSYPHGVWFYFPVLFLLKSPLAFLGQLLLAAAAGIALRFRRFRPGGTGYARPKGVALHWRAVWVFLVVYVAVCLLSRLDISIRHFSTPLVLMIVLMAPIPRLLNSLGVPQPRWIAVALAAISIFTAFRAYPNYFPFVNSLSMGQPAYNLVNDSNVDWNQALPKVRQFADDRALSSVLVDEWGFSEPTVYIPNAQFWNCQEPRPEDAGRWAVVSGNMLKDGHYCVWLLRYPYEALAGGSMFAFHLPVPIPPAGTPGGPPLPSQFRNFYFPPGRDSRLYFLDCVRDPRQLGPTMETMKAAFTKAGKST